MPKKKYTNRRVRKNMRGGNVEQNNIKSVENQRETKVVTKGQEGGLSSYAKYDDNLFIKFVLALGLMGIIWFLLTRSLVKHKYSETLSYGIISVSVIISLLLVLIAGLRVIKGGSGLLEAFKKVFNLAIFVLSKGLPGILILVQLGILIYIMTKNADYLFTADEYPPMFQEFNIIALLMLSGQLYIWKNQLYKILRGVGESNSSMTILGFILISIFSGIAISQLYVILEYLKTDC